MSNPKMAQAFSLINSLGKGDAQTAFYNYAKQLGVNPQEVLNIVKSYL